MDYDLWLKMGGVAKRAFLWSRCARLTASPLRNRR
jgi:hypothetical protein